MSQDEKIEKYLEIALRAFQKENYRKTLEICQEISYITIHHTDARIRIYLDLLIGDCFYFLHEYEAMIKKVDQALNQATKINDKNLMALSQVNLAKGLTQWLNPSEVSYYQQALDYLTGSVLVFEELNDSLGLLHTYRIWGELEETMGNHEEVRIAFRMAAKFAQALQKPHLVEYFQRRAEGGLSPTPFIYNFPHPERPPVPIAERHLKKQTCPFCLKNVDWDQRICPFCSFKLY